VVVIGGGVGGASVAYHLAERGETDVIVMERDELTSGSTFHSAGLVGQLRADPTLTRMNMYSVELYRKLQGTQTPPGWTESGGIKLASSTQRLEEIRRQISWARTFDLPLVEISAQDAQSMFPLMSTEGVVAGAYLSSDGHLDPSQLCYSLANAARALGVKFFTHTRVLGITTTEGRVTGVSTDRGDVECEVVVNCGGIFAAEIARMVGVRIPIVPMSHQYVVTQPLLEDPSVVLPTLRDPDLLVYYRQDVAGLVMGGYERNPAPWTADMTHVDDIPADFNGRLLPEDWTRFEEITENSQIRVPVMADAELRKVINGPEAFTPDNEFCLGETEVDGFFVAAGFCAHGIAGAGGIGQVMAAWVLDGDPGMDLWHMDIRRFGGQYRSPSFTLKRTLENYSTYYDIKYPLHERESARPLRMSPAYAWHAAHGASFGEKSGWERVNHYEANAAAGDEALRPVGWPGHHWSPAVGAEHRATRERAGLFDESSFAKIEVSGPGAPSYLEQICDNQVARGIGDVTYTQVLNHRGGIEADFTVTRVAEATFWIVTGTSYGSHDLALLRKRARELGADVRIHDMTGQYATYALWGPSAREIASTLTSADLSDEAFGFMTSAELTLGDIPVRALRVTFVGEHGWEFYVSSEYGASLWRSLMEAGEPFGLVPGGYRAIESMRLEKGYRVWSTDITPETTPYEAGLGFCVKLDKPGGFIGREALLAQKEAGISRRLACLRLDEPLRVALGSEPVRIAGKVVGRVTSAGYGYTVEASLAYAYLPIELAVAGTRADIDLFGEWIGAEVVKQPVLGSTR